LTDGKENLERRLLAAAKEKSKVKAQTTEEKEVIENSHKSIFERKQRMQFEAEKSFHDQQANLRTSADAFESEAQGGLTAEETNEREAKNVVSKSQFDLVLAMGERILGERTKIRA
jgi:hypothetical protein